MRIPWFTSIINTCSDPCVLRNTCLVIDGQNFFYNCYEESYLPYELGAECDQYAKYLKQRLNMFKQANIKCYFIFKGGTEKLEKKIEKDRKKQEVPKFGANPLFTSEVHLEVLDEMGYDYVFCEFEAKRDCIALAKKLACPVLSMDIEFAFSGVPYVPYKTITFVENKKMLKCKLFKLNNLLRCFRVDQDKVATFILLTDLNIFPEDSFKDFFKNRIIADDSPINRYKKMLSWLSKTPMNVILKSIEADTKIDMKQFMEELDKSKKHVRGEYIGGLPTYCILKEAVETEQWFEKGVALSYIPKFYIDVCRSNTLLVGEILDDNDAEPSIKITLNIIKYAYDLLTNFQNDGFKFIHNHWDSNSQEIMVKSSIKKPVYEAKSSVFENGWDCIRTLNLFQHFITEEINFDFEKLSDVPDDAKMLLISLIYFSHKKSGDTNKIAYGVLLSYVVLGVLSDNDLSFASAADSKLVAKLMDSYFNVTPVELNAIKMGEFQRPLREFQFCLKELNNLNKVCGLPFEPTIYSKTYNSTFVHKIVYCIHDVDEHQFINKILKPVPTVLNFVNYITNVYKKLL